MQIKLSKEQIEIIMQIKGRVWKNKKIKCLRRLIKRKNKWRLN